MWRAPTERDRAEEVYKRDERTGTPYVFCRYNPLLPSLLMLVGWVIVLLEVTGWMIVPWMFFVTMAMAFVRHVLVSYHVVRYHPDMPVLRAGRDTKLR